MANVLGLEDVWPPPGQGASGLLGGGQQPDWASRFGLPGAGGLLGAELQDGSGTFSGKTGFEPIPGGPPSYPTVATPQNRPASFGNDFLNLAVGPTVSYLNATSAPDSAARDANANAMPESAAATGDGIRSDATNSGIDYNLIATHEGRNRPVAYTLSAPKFPHSGVTVGVGVDLGQQSVRTLTNWGVAPADIETLRPYLGRSMRGQAAVDYLNRHPLTIGDSLADTLNRGAINSTIDGVARAFNDADPTMNFNDLPASERTVLADIAYQHGVGSLTDNLKRGTSFTGGAFWNAVVSNNRDAAANIYRNEALREPRYKNRLLDDYSLLRYGHL
jgi:hypothetical protein